MQIATPEAAIPALPATPRRAHTAAAPVKPRPKQHVRISGDTWVVGDA